MPTRRDALRRLGALSAATVPALVGSPALAQERIRQLVIIVAFPPGGATDAAARLVAEGLRGRYAESVVVENRAGAGGRVGAIAVKDAPADGSMLLYTPAFPLAIYPHIYRKLPYDALEEFVPVATLSKGAFVLSVGPMVPAGVRTARDFVAWCRANPDRATYGAPAGGGQHFAGVLFGRQADVPLKMIAYKGGAPSVTDVLGGHIASVITPVPEVIAHAKDGRLRMLATTTRQRTAATPDVPTMRELGWDVVFEDWSGLVAPARTPPSLVARINALVGDYARSDTGSAALRNLGLDIDLNDPPAFGKLYRETWERYREVVRTTGFTAED